MDDLYQNPAFIELRSTCDELYPDPEGGRGIGGDFALSRALNRLNIWRDADTEGANLSIVAARLDKAFKSKTFSRVHMVPLDLADQIPALSFGPNEVRTFSPDELKALVAPLGPVAAKFDARRFSEFQWLVCRDEIIPKGTPRQRGSLLWGLRLDRDFGAIDPHRKRFPGAVETALFCLLLAPWEEWHDHTDIDWRSFQTPWALTVDDDLFGDATDMRSPDSLTWEEHRFEDDSGEIIEYERPATYHGSSETSLASKWVTDERWNAVNSAFASPLFETPIVHFVLNGLLGDGIDEFMSHLTALESSLGRYEDSGRAKVVGARIAALLSDQAAGDSYGRLFNLRSEFVHGRVMDEISSVDRTTARSLARRIANELVDKATGVTDRVSFLEGLSPSKSSRRRGP